MDSGMIIPTLTPISALKQSSTQMLSTKNAPAPARTYRESPASASVLVFIHRHRSGKTMLVRMINKAGRLTMSWISSGLCTSKCRLITPNAGAMAAPAMTVNRLMERMVKSSLLFFIIIVLNPMETYSSTKLAMTILRRKDTKKFRSGQVGPYLALRTPLKYIRRR